MKRPLPRALLLLVLLGRTAGAGSGGACRLGPYGAPLPDNAMQCPDASGEASLDRAQRRPPSPGKARADDPPARKTGRLWIRIGSASAQEASRSPSPPSDAGVLLMEGEQCSKWLEGQASPVETFHCPTEDNQQEEMFCCGTCSAPYCCPSSEERLDQAGCPPVVEEEEDQEAAGPLSKHLGTVGLVEFIVTALGISTSFIVFFAVLRYRLESMEGRIERRVANAQLDLIREIHAVPVADSPPPGRAASATPDPSASSNEVSQIPPELPTAVADANPGRKVMVLPAFVLGRPLEAVPEGGGAGENEEGETVF